MAKIKELINYLEQIAPPSYQESYDNAGLITGDAEAELSAVLISLDCTEEIIEEAKQKRANLVIAHHPIIFRPLKRITGQDYVQRTVIQAIKNDIAIYAIHTNLDNISQGVNEMICRKLELKNPKILLPKKDNLAKLVTFIPQENTLQVLEAIHRMGAGQIGEYNQCSFRVTGTGAFKPSEKANPHIGTSDLLENVTEDRVEVIFPRHLKNQVLNALKKAHPYEEVAYYHQEVQNTDPQTGAGMIGNLEKELDEQDFIDHLKDKMGLTCIRHTRFLGAKVKRVAVCGGAGSFLLSHAIQHQAQAFVSADFKYHEFFDAENKIVIADIGHYESEVFTKELIRGLLNKKFPNIALDLSERNTNPVNYYF